MKKGTQKRSFKKKDTSHRNVMCRIKLKKPNKTQSELLYLLQKRNNHEDKIQFPETEYVWL
jgi:hypothetical protein